MQCHGSFTICYIIHSLLYSHVQSSTELARPFPSTRWRATKVRGKMMSSPHFSTMLVESMWLLGVGGDHWSGWVRLVHVDRRLRVMVGVAWRHCMVAWHHRSVDVIVVAVGLGLRLRVGFLEFALTWGPRVSHGTLGFTWDLMLSVGVLGFP